MSALPSPPVPCFWFCTCLTAASAMAPSSSSPSSGMGPRQDWPPKQPDQPARPLSPLPLPAHLPSNMAVLLWGRHIGCAVSPPPSPSPRGRQDGGPFLQGLNLFPPGTPLFLLKGTDCNPGPGTCFPPTSGPQKARCTLGHRPRTWPGVGEMSLPDARTPTPAPSWECRAGCGTL